MAKAISTDKGSLLQMNGPTTQGGTIVKTSNSLASPNSNAFFSAIVFAVRYGPSPFTATTLCSISVQLLSFRSSVPPEPPTSAATLEVCITRFTVFDFRLALKMPRVASIVCLFMTDWSGSPSMGVAKWNTPMHPSMASVKLSGWLRSAVKIWRFSFALGRLSKKLKSFFLPSFEIENDS